MDGIAVNGPIISHIRKDCLNPSIFGKKFEKYFQVENLIDIDIKVIFCIKLLLHHKIVKIKSRVLVNSIPWLCIVKNGKKWPISL